MLNLGQLHLSRCVVVSNIASAGYSAGVLNLATASIASSTFYGNFAMILGAGIGNVENFPGAPTPHLTLTNSTIVDNDTSGRGGGVYSDGVAILDGCTILRNRTGVYANQGSLLLRHTVVAQHSSEDVAGILRIRLKIHDC